MKTNLIKTSKATFIEIDNEKGFKVTLTNYGAAIYNIELNGKTMMLSPKDYDTFCDAKCYFGKAVGRFAGRARKGIIKIDGVEYQTTMNEPTNSLHGGKHGFSYTPFDYEVNDNEVIFTLNDKEGELPGDVNAKFIYTVSKDENELTVKMVANTTKKTIMNLTTHPYFNLSGDLAEPISEHYFLLACDKNAVLDDTLMFTSVEKVNEVNNFQEGHFINKYLTHPSIYKDPTMGYDNLFIKKDFKDEFVCNLACLSSKINMTITSDYPAVVCYTYNYPLDDMVFIPNKKVTKHYGIAIEPQLLPMSVSEEYYNLGLLDKDQTYDHYIKYSFSSLKED